MTDYFNDYNSFIAAKDLPSPADTPYETPAFIRSKRSSRATAASSREEESPSPPPLPPDAAAAAAAQPAPVQEKVRDGLFTGSVDTRRLTPNLHASLVSEILNLRREVDAKNKLVENLETSLSSSRNENEELAGKLSSSAKEMRQAKREVQQMEKGTLDALEDLVKERDTAKSTVEDLKGKLDAANKVTRRQDDDALRTQRIWESEKENWEAERRQLERRVHVTESRLRTFVDGVAAQQHQQQAAAEAQKVVVETADGGVDDSVFKDSGLGNESDTASVPSVANSPTTNNRTRGHRRNHSSLSYSSSRRSNRTLRNSLADRGTPDPATASANAKTGGYSLADELGIDEEEEYDIDDFEHADEDEDLEYPEPAEHVRRNLESRLSRQGSVASDAGSQKAMRVLGLALDNVDSPVAAAAETSAQAIPGPERSPLHQELQTSGTVEKPRVQYVDTGYQPSPPPSPDRKALTGDGTLGSPAQEESTTQEDSAALESPRDREADAARLKAASPISPPETPVIGQEMWSKDASPTTPTATGPVYMSSSTQTDEAPAASPAAAMIEDTRPKTPEKTKPPASNRLSSPSLVPSIAIHPPSSRPSTPRTYVLPPRTKNAATQANISEPRSYRHASMQTELIRIDHRPLKLPPHLQPSYLLPSPNLPEPSSEVERLASRKRDLMSKFSTAPRLAASASPPSMLAMAQREMHSQGQAQAQSLALAQQQSLPSSRSRSPSLPLEGSSRDNRAMPLRMIPLPRPVLSPPFSQDEFPTEGPLNRSAKYGVSKSTQAGSSRLLEGDKDSDMSDYEDALSVIEPKNLAGSLPGIAKSHSNRVGHVEPPKTVPEDKEISPDHRPDTAGSSGGAAPAPSISSSRAASQARGKQPVTSNSKGKNIRSRSPSFGSMASSNQSASNYSFPGVPPFPIPTRSSSRIMPNSYSEGSQSPTPYYGASSSHRSHRTRDRQYGYASSSKDNKLRKVQSATAIRQQAAASASNGTGGGAGGSAGGAAAGSSSSGRRTSPPRPRRRRHAPDLTPVQSMALDSPDPTTALPGLGGDATPSFLLDNFPYGDIGGPVNGTGGSYADSGAPPTTAGSSVGAAQSQGQRGGRNSVQQQQQQQHRDASPEPDPTNLVDAIAATMVGEWMWKYIRKRKSFGVGEDPVPSLPINAEDGGAAAANAHAHGGSRHKRWVWLSPYERCIMWDSKQPTSGSALLGKKGRRLAIQSVMDVHDETPLPRGGELASAFNRSILILTPERALKFTAVSARRHAFWITALSFLADSARPNTLPIPGAPGGEGGVLRPIPSVPSIDSVPIKRHRSPSFGRLQVRDSVRLTKGKKRFTASSAAKDGNSNAANAGPAGNTNSAAGAGSGARNSASINQTAPLPPDEPEEDDEEGAAFPSIPRLYSGTTRHQRKRSNTSPRLPGSNNTSSGNAAARGAAAPPAFRSASSSSAGHNNQTSSTNAPSYYPSRARNAGGAGGAAASSSSAAGTVASLSSTLRHAAGGIANSSSRSAGSTTAGSVSGGGRRESFISAADPYNNSHYGYSYQYTHQPNLSLHSRDNYYGGGGGGSSNGSGSVGRPNFFEAVGTVRMEAFVDPNVRDGVLYVPAPPPSLLPQQHHHHPPQPSHPPPAVPATSRNKHSGGHRGKSGVNGNGAAESSGVHGGGAGRDTSAAGLLEEIKRKGIHLFDDVEEGSAGDPFRGF